MIIAIRVPFSRRSLAELVPRWRTEFAVYKEAHKLC